LNTNPLQDTARIAPIGSLWNPEEILGSFDLLRGVHFVVDSVTFVDQALPPPHDKGRRWSFQDNGVKAAK